MSTATIIEAGIAVDPVTADPFVADLVDYRSPEAAARVADFLARAATGPRDAFTTDDLVVTMGEGRIARCAGDVSRMPHADSAAADARARSAVLGSC